MGCATLSMPDAPREPPCTPAAGARGWWGPLLRQSLVHVQSRMAFPGRGDTGCQTECIHEHHLRWHMHGACIHRHDPSTIALYPCWMKSMQLNNRIKGQKAVGNPAQCLWWSGCLSSAPASSFRCVQSPRGEATCNNDMLGLHMEISFSADAHSRGALTSGVLRKGANVHHKLFMVQRGPVQLKWGKGLIISKLLLETCSITHWDSAAQRQTGHTISHLKIWGVGMFDIASYPTEWWIALRGAIKAAEAV